MPFPLAHPAAVLPLRRLKQLDFSALLIGAVTPDLSYCFERYDLDDFAHTIRGCFAFSLPVGWLAVLIFQAVRDPLIELLPEPHRQAFAGRFSKSGPAWFTIPLSILVGAGTHVFWDAFTHETGWFVERSSFLQLILFSIHGHRFRLYRILWHISTWVGLFLLWRAYLQAVRKRTGSAQLFDPAERRRYTLWAGLLSLPLLGVLPFLVWQIGDKGLSLGQTLRSVRSCAAVYLVIVSLLLIAVGASLKVRDRPRQ